MRNRKTLSKRICCLWAAGAVLLLSTGASAKIVDTYFKAGDEIEVSVEEGKAVTFANDLGLDAEGFYVKGDLAGEWENLLSTTADFEKAPAILAIRLEAGEDSYYFYADLSTADSFGLNLSEGKTFLSYKDEKGEEKKTLEIEGQEPEASYAGTDVNLRATPSKDGDVVKVLSAGTPVMILGTDGEWSYALVGEDLGFVMSEFLDAKYVAPQASASYGSDAGTYESDSYDSYSYDTDSYDSYDSYDDYGYDYNDYDEDYDSYTPPTPSEGGSSGGIYEVSRESVPTCADGTHGFTYITYSDGSVVVEEY